MKKTKIISIFILIVSAASVAYASFATNLVINGTGTATGNWKVEIIGITPTGQVGATDKLNTPSYTATSATFDVDLGYPGATSSYQVVIKNNGTIPAKLNSVTDLTSINASAPTYLTYSLSGVTVGSTLAVGAQVTATVTVTWDAAANTNPSGASKAATITLNYVQNT